MNVDFDKEVLAAVIYEFGHQKAETDETDAKLKKRLQRKKLGAFNEVRVKLLREFKDTVQKEVHRNQRSKYYTPNEGRVARIEDFQRTLMTQDYSQLFPSISRDTICWFVDFAVFTYYCR